jgi:hypothetical protein
MVVVRIKTHLHFLRNCLALSCPTWETFRDISRRGTGAEPGLPRLQLFNATLSD